MDRLGRRTCFRALMLYDSISKDTKAMLKLTAISCGDNGSRRLSQQESYPVRHARGPLAALRPAGAYQRLG